jgi:hypothetical protein
MISQQGPIAVKAGMTQIFTLTPSSGYTVGSITGTCGPGLKVTDPSYTTGTPYSYTTSAIYNNCTVIANFVRAYAITVTATGAPGSIITSYTGIDKKSFSSPGMESTLVASDATLLLSIYGLDAKNSIASVGGSCGGTLYNSPIAYTPGTLRASYITNPIKGDCTILVATIPGGNTNNYTVTASQAGGRGTFSTQGAFQSTFGSTRTFRLQPDPGYTGVVTGTCSGTLIGNTYTTKPITGNCTVEVSFAPMPAYTITPSVVGGNGTISPSSGIVLLGNSITDFILTPQAGYIISSVDGTCGGALNGNTYTTKPIDANCTVIATFVQGNYTVTPSVSGNIGGTISPATPVKVKGTTTTTFTLTPSVGFNLISVGGTCGGA